MKSEKIRLHANRILTEIGHFCEGRNELFTNETLQIDRGQTQQNDGLKLRCAFVAA